MKKSVFLKSALALALVIPLLASAESQLRVGAGNAVAHLNFKVIIPQVLFLAVGTGNALPVANNGTIDTLTFDYTTTPAEIGSGTDSAAQDVNVRVLGNYGQIEVAATSSTTGLVSDLVPADIIPWSEILASSSDSTNFDVPAVGSSANPTLSVSGGKVTARVATWSYRYSNTNVVAEGQYDGQVTYTASIP